MPSSTGRQNSGDRIVVVMGPTGAGKSTFIERATGQNNGSVGHSWQSHTAEIQSIRVVHPTDGHPVVFVDTPGFDDTYKTDTEILAMIADWLVKAYKGNVNLAAILYLHRITDNRMSGSAMKNLRLFSSLCGRKAMPHVAIVTTMWSRVDRDEGLEREGVLKREVWKDMLEKGCSVERFDNTCASTWRIIDSIGKTYQAPVSLPREIVDDHLRLNETQVGIALHKELERLIKGQHDLALSLKGHVENQDDEQVLRELNNRKMEIDEKIRQTADQLRQMKVPMLRKVRLFFKNKRN